MSILGIFLNLVLTLVAAQDELCPGQGLCEKSPSGDAEVLLQTSAHMTSTAQYKQARSVFSQVASRRLRRRGGTKRGDSLDGFLDEDAEQPAVPVPFPVYVNSATCKAARDDNKVFASMFLEPWRLVPDRGSCGCWEKNSNAVVGHGEFPKYLKNVMIGNISRRRNCTREWAHPYVQTRTQKWPTLGVEKDLEKHVFAEETFSLHLGGYELDEWDMCRNLEYVVCGAQGKLKNQPEAKFWVATPPSTYDIRKSLPDDEMYYEADFVFLWESCYLSSICKNGADLFEMKEPGFFECEFDEEAFWKETERFEKGQVVEWSVSSSLFQPAPEKPQKTYMLCGELPKVPELPVLKAPGDHKAWDDYLEKVYGEPLKREDYPVDLNTFEFFYDFSPLGAIEPVEVQLEEAVPYGTVWTGPPNWISPEHLVTNRAKGFFVQRYELNMRPEEMGIAEANAWVEVHRANMDFYIPGKSDYQATNGLWYFRARGSGIFINTGDSTYVVQGQADGEIDNLMLEEFREAGVRTLQSPISVANPRIPMKTNRFEIVDLKHGNKETHTCGGVYRTGFAAHKECKCSNDVGVLNCGKDWQVLTETEKRERSKEEEEEEEEKILVETHRSTGQQNKQKEKKEERSKEDKRAR